MTEYMTEKAVVRIHGTVDYTKLKEAAEVYIREVEQIDRRGADYERTRNYCHALCRNSS